MTAREISKNALVAAAYAAIAIALPATAAANWRLATALYLLAAFDRELVPGLALGNGIAGIPQGPLDVLFGVMVGGVTASACALAGKWAGPAFIFAVPTLVVPLWLSAIFHAPYAVVWPVVALGQAASAALAWAVVLPLGNRLWRA